MGCIPGDDYTWTLRPSGEVKRDAAEFAAKATAPGSFVELIALWIAGCTRTR